MTTPPGARRQTEIAGSGFAGLAAATALCQHGWSVWVQEADAELRAFGAGIHYEMPKLERWSEGSVAIIGEAAHAMPPTLGQRANSAICNALGLAVALDERDTVRDALELWEARERPLTDHTQRRAGEIAGSRVLAGGMNWDDEGMRAARSIPTGARELVMG